jgi:hypothetical protein
MQEGDGRKTRREFIVDVGRRPVLRRAGFGLAGDVAEDVPLAEGAVDGVNLLVDRI